MPRNVMGSLVEKLDRVYVCRRCGMPFLFESDVEDHEQTAGHREMCEFQL